MDELDFDPDRFVFSYPVWMCVRPRSDDVIGGSVEGGGKFIAVFTDEDLADRFLANIGLAGQCDLVNYLDKENFMGALRHLQAPGYTHIGVDPPGRESDRAKLIEEVLRDAEEDL